MKARVKATGEIVEVSHMYASPFSNDVCCNVKETNYPYLFDELDFDYACSVPDYWERLKHQYAGMAMQSYVSNNEYLREIREMCKEPQEMRDLIADLSILLATTLVQKLKEKEERK